LLSAIELVISLFRIVDVTTTIRLAAVEEIAEFSIALYIQIAQ